MTTEEAGFQAAIDADWNDTTARLVFSDWLRERDDPRAAGYQAMVVVGFVPYWNEGVNSDGTVCCVSDFNQKKLRNVVNTATVDKSKLPAFWWQQVKANFKLNSTEYEQELRWNEFAIGSWIQYYSRQEAEDEAANAFSQLPQYIQDRILNGDFNDE